MDEATLRKKVEGLVEEVCNSSAAWISAHDGWVRRGQAAQRQKAEEARRRHQATRGWVVEALVRLAKEN